MTKTGRLDWGRLALDEIQILDRYRQDLGDIDALILSIRDVGLLQPVVISRENELIAGQRRLEAVRRLGWATIPFYRVSSLTDAAARLRAERDDNTCRKAMLPSELAALGAALDQIERPAANDRRAATQTQHMVRGEHGRIVGNRPRGGNTGERPLSLTREPELRSADVVGKALGISGRTYSDLRMLHKLANSEQSTPEEKAIGERALKLVDSGEGIKRITDSVRPDVRELRGKPRGDNTRTLPTGGRARIRGEDLKVQFMELAGRGHSSAQIAADLGFTVEYVRRRTRELGVEIPADKVLSRSHKGFDSTRILSEVVIGLEGTVSALELIDLSTVEVTEEMVAWTEAIQRTVRRITQFNRQLKEKVNGA